MQNVNDAVGTGKGGLLTAKELLEVTATEKELQERRIEQYKQDFMTTMVQQATQSGRKSYGVQFIKEDSMPVMDQIIQDFEGLGYTVTKEETVQSIPNAKNEVVSTPIVVLIFSWENAGAN